MSIPLENFEEANKENAAPAAAEAAEDTPSSNKAVLRVPVNVQVVIGNAKMPVNQVLRLSRGAVIELDRKVGEPVDIMINDRTVARGELVIVDGDRIGVTLVEIVKEGSLDA
jgi:flagellar motor switch protein FliN/FliY